MIIKDCLTQRGNSGSNRNLEFSNYRDFEDSIFFGGDIGWGLLVVGEGGF